jgi:hypothetical protein
MFEIIKLDIPVEPDNLINKYANEQAKVKAHIIDNLFFKFVAQLGISISPYQEAESIKRMLADADIEIDIQYSVNNPDEITFIAKQIIKTQVSKIEL